MSSNVKYISIKELRPGMFVEDIVNKNGRLLLSSNNVISNINQINLLMHQGVTHVFINIKKSSSRPAETPRAEAIKPDTREEAYYKEIEKAKQIRFQTIATAKDFLTAAKNKLPFSITEAKNASEDIVESVLRNSDALVSLCQLKGYDEYTYTHSVNVSVLTASLAYSLGYARDQLVDIGLGALLHDIGKMRVPDSILNKPGQFNDNEFRIMKKHPTFGIELVACKKNLSDLSKTIIIQHHERFNGSGYPLGLKGSEIAEVGLIAAVADVYDALTSNRVYKNAWTPQKALGVIFQGCEETYSRNIVEHFTKLIGIYPVGSFVRLASGEMGVVTRIDSGKLLAPTMVALFDTQGKPYKPPKEYDLSVKQQESNGKDFVVEISLDPTIYGVNVAEYIAPKPAGEK